MPTTDFFNVNAHRSYPFLALTTGLPVDGPLTLNQLPWPVIVDAGFTAGPRSRFVADEHEIYLHRIARSGDVFTFEFRSDAPELIDVPLIFTRILGDETNSTEYLDSGDEGFSESGSESTDLSHCDDPLWAGYLVTGDLTYLDAFLSGDGEVTAGDVIVAVEPVTIINLAASYVTSLSLANADRTRNESPDDCPEAEWPYPVGAVFINRRCIVGETIVIKPGFNASVRQNEADNSITIGAVVGGGEGQPCDEVPLFDAEESPDGSNLLAGGPRCNEVVRSLNGVGGPIIRVTSSHGANIIALPEENKLVIDLNMSGLSICYDSHAVVSESI